MRVLLRLVITIVVAAIGTTALVVAVVPQVARMVTSTALDGATLPDFAPLSQKSTMYDAVGNVIGQFAAENLVPVKISQVPKGVIDAVLAVEDESFYDHKGVNAKSLMQGGAGQRLSRRRAAGRFHHHPASGEEQLPHE